MIIDIENNQDKFNVDTKELEEVLKFVLNHEGVKVPWEVNVILTDNEEIREINSMHRGIDRETDCLSFPMLSYKKGNVFKDEYIGYEFSDSDLNEGNLVLGDIIISLEKAKAQSLEFNHSFDREVKYLLIHSILHLLGYDHIENCDKIVMREREKSIIKELKIFR